MRFLRNSLIGVFLLSVTVGLFALAANIVYGALEARWARRRRSRPRASGSSRRMC
jgi:ABC-type spermidine/putrescine transport system permease subunit II